MQQELIHEPMLLTGTTVQTDKDSDDGSQSRHAAVRTPYNLPSPSEKLADNTLPLNWPTPYLDQEKREGLPLAPQAASPVQQAASTRLPDDYAQLMRKLQAESVAAQQATQVDKALSVAHYVSILIAALGLMAMVGLIILTSFPSLLHD